jgi:hypothetical protein
MKVEFTLCIYSLVSGMYPKTELYDKTRKMIEKVFDIDLRMVTDHRTFTITCSAEAFVRFQIEREKLGLMGRWKELKVKIVKEESPITLKFISKL